MINVIVDDSSINLDNEIIMFNELKCIVVKGKFSNYPILKFRKINNEVIETRISKFEGDYLEFIDYLKILSDLNKFILNL